MKRISRLIFGSIVLIGIMALVSLVSDSFIILERPGRPPKTEIPETEYRKYLTQADSLFDIRQYDPAAELYAEYSLAMMYGNPAMRYRNESKHRYQQADNRRLACELILLLSSDIQSTVSQNK